MLFGEICEKDKQRTKMMIQDDPNHSSSVSSSSSSFSSDDNLLPLSSSSSLSPTRIECITSTTTRQKSSQCWLKRWPTWFIMIGFIVFFYLATNCWSSSLGGIFVNQRYLLNEITKQHDSLSVAKESKKLCPTFGRLRSVLPSLMVRPLKNVSQSTTVNSLTEAKLKILFRIANQTMEKGDLMDCNERQFWNAHQESYEKRRLRLNRICQRYGFMDRIFNTWHIMTNRRVLNYHNKNQTVKFCNTRTCPLLVDADHRLVTCFVQKIASTSIKQLYWYLMEPNGTDTSTNNNKTDNMKMNGSSSFQHISDLTNFHMKMNDKLYRISPAYLAYSKEANYFKTIFVRHPFVRVVSAFKDKAERNPDEETYFYDRYWNPLLERLHGKERDPNLRVTFREFVEELLLPTDPYQYDEHWAPIWTRCEPCFIHYDFIGKLETAQDDFNYFKSSAKDQNLMNLTFWQNLNHQFGQADIETSKDRSQNQSQDEKILSITTTIKPKLKKCQRQRLKYAETIKYLSQLSSKTLIELYKRYYLDFELFGYSIEELFEAIAS